MPDLSLPEAQSLYAPLIADRDLVIVDNLSTICRSVKENEADSWVPVQNWALKLRRQGKSVLFIHHGGKSGQQRGSSRKEDVLDTVIALRRPPDYSADQGARFEVHFEKSRGFYGPDAEPFEAWLPRQSVGGGRDQSRRRHRVAEGDEEPRHVHPRHFRPHGLSTSTVARRLERGVTGVPPVPTVPFVPSVPCPTLSRVERAVPRCRPSGTPSLNDDCTFVIYSSMLFASFQGIVPHWDQSLRRCPPMDKPVSHRVGRDVRCPVATLIISARSAPLPSATPASSAQAWPWHPRRCPLTGARKPARHRAVVDRQIPSPSRPATGKISEHLLADVADAHVARADLDLRAACALVAIGQRRSLALKECGPAKGELITRPALTRIVCPKERENWRANRSTARMGLAFCHGSTGQHRETAYIRPRPGDIDLARIAQVRRRSVFVGRLIVANVAELFRSSIAGAFALLDPQPAHSDC